jgi:RHS repeat-associated protein
LAGDADEKMTGDSYDPRAIEPRWQALWAGERAFTAPGGSVTSYDYDANGNVLERSDANGHATTYTYDAADELLSATRNDKVTLYSYDQDGNEIQAGDTRYAYNLENKLTSQRGAGKPVSYTYTGDGLMSPRRAPSETTSYAWDTSEDLPELALETVSKGKKSQTSAYTYGAGPIGLVNEAGSYAFHTDSLGSVAELSDAGGTSVESYRYSPYGEAYAPGNSAEASSRSSNPIRFTGQYLDSESDLYNMRARQYQPETGRFLETDPLEADTGSSAVGVYVYVNDQPTVMTDPTGEKAMMGADTNGVSRVSCGSAKRSCRSSCFTTSIGGPKGTQGPQGDTDLYRNGCGPGGWLERRVSIPEKMRGLYDFDLPCSHHDECYGGRRSWGNTMSYCNNKFGSEMRSSCDHKFKHWLDPRIQLCKGAAFLYKQAVDNLGYLSYYNGQMKLCTYSHMRCCLIVLSRMRSPVPI